MTWARREPLRGHEHLLGSVLPNESKLSSGLVTGGEKYEPYRTSGVSAMDSKTCERGGGNHPHRIRPEPERLFMYANVRKGRVGMNNAHVVALLPSSTRGTNQCMLTPDNIRVRDL